ncbi:MAG: hypothetical protein U1E76_05910 [Planctomycetota bacterium]
MRYLAMAGSAFVIAAFSGSFLHRGPTLPHGSAVPHTIEPDLVAIPIAPLAWDDARLTAQALAVLEDNVGPTPDVRRALGLVASVCRSVDGVNDPPRAEDGWRWWDLPPRDDQSLRVMFARGTDEGMEASRVVILLAPFVSVSAPYQAAGSLIDVKVRSTRAGRPEVVMVVCSAPDMMRLPFHMQGELPELTLGHRFRFGDDGKVHVIRYSGQLRHTDRHVIENNYGSSSFEYDGAGLLERGVASAALAWIERHIP